MRPVRPTKRAIPHLLLLFVSVTLLFSAHGAFAVVLGSADTEIIGPRVFQVTLADGRMRVIPDLAASGQIIVKVWPNTSPEVFARVLADTGCSLEREFSSPGLLLINLPAGMKVNDGVNLWERQTITQYAAPNRLKFLQRVPNDPEYPNQWHWPHIDADRAWDIQTGSSEIIVAVVDSGIQLDHPDLAGRIWRNPGEIAGNGLDDDGNGYIDDVFGWDFVNDNNDPNPNVPEGSGIDEEIAGAVSHGTHVAGIIGAVTNNALGVAGHDWNCKIMAVQVFDETGLAFDDTILAGYEYAVDNGAHIINMSLGGGYSEAYNEPIARAYASGILTVAAAGNERHEFTNDRNTWMSPVCNDGDGFLDNFVLGVGATDRNDVIAYFSNYDGSSRSFVDVMAPGVNILSTMYYDPVNEYNEPYGEMSGTSMAAPVVAGLASLVKAQFRHYSPEAIIRQIRGSCEDIDEENQPRFAGKMGAGRVNSANALIDLPPGAVRSPMAFDTPNDDGGSITISWGLSPDDGRGFNDVIGYEILRSESAEGPFVRIAQVERGVTVYIDSPVPDYTDFYYQIVVRDAVNRVPSPVLGPVQARDDTPPPAITTLVAVDTPADDGGSISLSWHGYRPPADFWRYRIWRAEASFTSVTGMTPIAVITDPQQTSYRDVDDPARGHRVIDGTRYWYAITAQDDEPIPNEITDVTAVGPVVSSPNFSFSYPPGLSMIAVGAQPMDPNLGRLFRVPAGAALDFARFDPTRPSNDPYHIYSQNPNAPALQQKLGRGFWLRSSVPTVLDIAGFAAPDGDVAVEFAAGWNQLGNPYTVALPMSDAIVRVQGTEYDLLASNEQGLTRDYMWRYDPFTAGYKLVSPILPFAETSINRGEGFFFLAMADGELVLPRPDGAARPRPAAIEAATQALAPAAGDWLIRLVATAGDSADTDNFMGVSAHADRFNGVVAPPPVSGGVQLYFARDNARRATDFVETLGAGASWDVRVAATAGSEVRISWPDLSQLPAECRPMLRDPSTGLIVAMRTSNGYGFEMRPGENERKLFIEIGTLTGEQLAIRTMDAQAAQSGAHITYTLSAPAQVDVAILNIAGRKVQQVQSARAAEAGLNSALWNGCNASGARVPAGVYLVRLTARSENGEEVSAVRTININR